MAPVTSAVANAAVLGLAMGVLGSVAPGPLSVALIFRRTPAAVLPFPSGLGGPVVHVILCVAIALCASPLFAAGASTRLGELALGFACAAFGLAVAAAELSEARTRRPDAPLESVALSSRILILKWLLVLGTVVTGEGSASTLGWRLAFAAGVWVGVATWFGGLTLFARPAHEQSATRLVHRLVVVGAMVIALVGGSGAIRALALN